MRLRCRLRRSHLEALERYLPLVEIQTGRDDLIIPEEVFHRKAPLYVEVGCGNGEFLYNLAVKNPSADFIGIEIFLTGIAKLLRRMLDYGRSTHPSPANLRIIRVDARIILERFPDHSVDGFYILFPDPWPKKRHHKRRLINNAFAGLLLRKLKPHGFVVITTDHGDYASQIEDSMKEAGFYEEILEEGEVILNTKYFKKALSEGRKIYSYMFLKSQNL